MRGFVQGRLAGMPGPPLPSAIVLDWSNLQVFLELKRAGSLARAGEALKMDPSTVSRRIDSLERELGARLFRRTPRGFFATPTGERIALGAEQVAQSVAAIRRESEGGDSQASGTVTLTAPEAFGVHYLIPRLTSFLQSQRAIDIVLLTDDRILSMAQGKADIAIRLTRPTEPSLVARKVAEIDLAFYATPDYLARAPGSVTPGLKGHEVVSYAGHLAELPEARWIAEHARATRIRLKVTSVLAMAAAVASGVGMGVLSQILAEEHPALRRVGDVPGLAARDVFVVVHGELRKTSRVRLLADAVAAAIAADTRMGR
jgi:DNA-binding transcriptional LysR family regulator